jgi:hypothetical protein
VGIAVRFGVSVGKDDRDVTQSPSCSSQECKILKVITIRVRKVMEKVDVASMYTCSGRTF